MCDRESRDIFSSRSGRYNNAIISTQEDNVLNFQKKEQMTKYGQRRLGIKGEVEKAIISHVTGPK